jgi:hypothetical protein
VGVITPLNIPKVLKKSTHKEGDYMVNLNLTSFNFACTGIAFRFLNEQKPEVLVVEYLKDDHTTQPRLPGGNVTFDDILNAIKYVESKNQNFDGDFSKLIIEVESIKDLFEESVDSYFSRHDRNMFFDRKLRGVHDSIEKLGFESLIQKFAFQSRIQALVRKFTIETNASSVGKLFPVSSSILNFNGGTHEKCGFVSVDIKAPDYYYGSGDKDIAFSHWRPVGEIFKKLFVSKSSNHQNFLQEAIRYAVENNLHPRVGELKEYWVSSGHL